MAFAAIRGQEPAVQTLRRALRHGRVHHAYRFEGPDGVGKEMAAMALAQALLCERDGPEACEACSACQRAVTLSEEEPHVPLHPDLVLVQRGLYAAAVSASEATGISVEQIRKVVLSRAGFPPHEGRALVFIVKDADELTPQAANSLLKTLEEPHDRTHFVLLTSRPNKLLDTIRSRTLAVRFGPLPDAVVADLLSAAGLDPEVAPMAAGSASLAFELSDPERLAALNAFVQKARDALAAPDLAGAIEIARDRPEGRDALKDDLNFLAQALARAARERVQSDPRVAERAARHHAIVQRTLFEVDRNVSPALALEAMVTRLRAS